MKTAKVLTKTRKLSTLYKVETAREIDRVTEGYLLSGGQIDIFGTRGVEREAALWVVIKVIRARRVVCLHGFLAIRSIGVVMGETLEDSGWTEGRISEGKCTFGGAGGPRLEEVTDREKLVE
jgi:hypothetical protein